MSAGDSIYRESIVALFVAVAMLGAFVSSLYSVIKEYSWVVFLSSVVCGIALASYVCILYTLHLYSKSAPTFNAKPPDENSALRSVVTHIRYIDWVLTLPMLSFKLSAMARDGPEPVSSFLDLDKEYIDLICAFASIACVVWGYLASGISVYGDHKFQFWPSGVLFVLATSLMCVNLTFIYAVAWQTETSNRGRIIAFSIAWVVYPIVFMLKELRLLSYEEESTAYSVLDVHTKAAFTFVTVFAH